MPGSAERAANVMTRVRSGAWPIVAGWVVGIMMTACPRPDATAPRPESNAPPAAIPDPPPGATGPELYAMQCASCHGAMGIGGVAPALAGWSKGEAVFVDVVAARMPVGRPEACDADCARTIFASLDTIAPAVDTRCDDAAPRWAPRRLRLLTRHELTRTVDALLPAPACDEHRFTFRPASGRPASVIVAGSFNGWAPTEAEGGWPMTWSPVRGAFVLTRALEDGAHTYKLVVDGTWMEDPEASDRAPDGFGGFNSVVEIACANAAPPADPYRGLPAEIRPEHFPFDDHVESAIVTPVHVTEHFEATRELAARVTDRIEDWVSCDPADAACSRAFVEAFGRRAFRRPLETEEIDRYAATIRGAPDFLEGVTQAVRVMLASPRFLYRSELGDAGTLRLDPYETASALAYFLWSAPPDDALLAKAADGTILDASVRRAEADRMLEDPRAAESLGRFAGAWLGAEKILTVDKQPATYGALTPEVRASMLAATRRFFTHVALEADGDLDTLLTADFAFRDDTLASFYGEAPVGGGFAKAPLASPRRAGVLAHGSVLGAYGHSDQNSPILRGKLVRERVLCQVFGVPPPDAGGVPNVDPDATTRERFAQHSSNERCAGCHRYLDEVGFAFESFDTIGHARTEENGHPIDPSGTLEDVEAFGAGTAESFADLEGLASALAASDRVATCFTTQVWRYQTGQSDTVEDRCTIEAIADRFRANGRNVRQLLLDVVADEAFVRRRAEP